MNKFMTGAKGRKNIFYEGWQETMEIMADPELDKGLEEAMKEMKAGNLHKGTVSFDEAKKRLKL